MKCVATSYLILAKQILMPYRGHKFSSFGYTKYMSIKIHLCLKIFNNSDKEILFMHIESNFTFGVLFFQC